MGRKKKQHSTSPHNRPDRNCYEQNYQNSMNPQNDAHHNDLSKTIYSHQGMEVEYLTKVQSHPTSQTPPTTLQHLEQKLEKKSEELTLNSESQKVKSCASAKKKSRRKKQKKRYKEKKRSQLQIFVSTQNNESMNSVTNKCYGQESDSNYSSQENNKIDISQLDNETKTCVKKDDADDASISTIPTTNTSVQKDSSHDRILDSFDDFATFGRYKSKNCRHDKPFSTKYCSKRNSDCFNQVFLDSGQTQIRYSWLNNVSWIGKHIGSQSILISGTKIELRDVDHNHDRYGKEEARNLENKLMGLKTHPIENESIENFHESDNEYMEKLDFNLEQNYTFSRKRQPSSQFPNSKIVQNNSNTKSMAQIAEETNSLSLQLHQIKTRLWPAVIQCTNIRTSQDANDNQMSMQPFPNNIISKNRVTPRQVFEQARRACNPFEELGEGRKGGLNNIFLNRSAMKLVNIDALLDFSILPDKPTLFSSSSVSTSGRSPSIPPIVSPHPQIVNTLSKQTQKYIPFRFVDLCGAPGGFTEYILRRCTIQQVSVQGWGLSLIGKNENGPGLEWKLEHLLKMKETHFRVSGGADGTGDILEWANVEALRDEIWQNCCDNGTIEDTEYLNYQNHNFFANDDGNGIHRNQVIDLVVADGGCQAQRDSSQQEELTLRMVLSEMAAALSLLKIGGKLVIKLFGFQTPQMKAAMRYLWNHFGKITVIKPTLSRPASTERYLVCFEFLGVEKNWNGSIWRDEITSLNKEDLKDEIMFGENETEICQPPNFNLDKYFVLLDRDILELNVKACFGILSHLEGDCKKKQDEKYTMNCKSSKHYLDLNMYRTAWRLK